MTSIPGATPDCRLNHVRAGNRQKPLVVLVHAVGLDLTYWGAQIDALGTTYDVIAYDLRGHGASTPTPAGYDLETHAADLAAIIKHAANGAAHVIGLSVGGMIAQTLALSRPDLVRSLALLDTASTFADAGRAAMEARAAATRAGGMQAVLAPTLERWLTPAFAARRPDVVDRVTKTLLAADARVHAAMWDGIAMLDVATRLGEIDKPTLVLVGELDPSTPVAAAEHIAARIRGSRLSVLPDLSHLSPLEGPAVVNEELLRFLAG